MPGRRSKAPVNHSAIHSEFAPPLTLDLIHSGWYFEVRGKRSERSSLSEITLLPILAHGKDTPRCHSDPRIALRLLLPEQRCSTASSADGPAPSVPGEARTVAEDDPHDVARMPGSLNNAGTHLTVRPAIAIHRREGSDVCA